MADSKQKVKKEEAQIKAVDQKKQTNTITTIPPKLVGVLADEVAKTLLQRLPGMLPYSSRSSKKKKSNKNNKRIEYGVFLDTSAIIDGRIFDVIHIGFVNGVICIPESILMELKHIADSQDTVKRERGRKGLEYLEKLKKTKEAKVIIADESVDKKLAQDTKMEVDERLIRLAKFHKGKIITCDYNLEKKANIQGVKTINMNALANVLKITAVPGEAVHVKLLHTGKDQTQGVGYLDDGTMLVVENGSTEVGRSIDVVISRVIQTATGRILFAKKI